MTPIRRPALGWLLAAALAALAAVGPASAAAQRGRRGGMDMPRLEVPNAKPAPAARPPLGTGLAELSQLPPEQREQRLRQDPAFQKLPTEEQQQILNGLKRFNAMSPRQQQRLSRRMQELGELSSKQRTGLEQIYHQFQTMPPRHRFAFRMAYHRLRALPADQQAQRLNAPWMQQRFSPAELKALRQALNLNLPSDLVGGRF